MSALVALRAPGAFTADLPPLPKDPLSATTDPSSGDKVRVVYLRQSSCRLTRGREFTDVALCLREEQAVGAGPGEQGGERPDGGLGDSGGDGERGGLERR